MSSANASVFLAATSPAPVAVAAAPMAANSTAAPPTPASAAASTAAVDPGEALAKKVLQAIHQNRAASLEELSAQVNATPDNVGPQIAYLREVGMVDGGFESNNLRLSDFGHAVVKDF